MATMPSIPKGLTIGYDNWADMTPKGMAQVSMKYNKEVYTEMFAELGKPDLTDDELNARLKTYFEELLSCNPVVVKAAHPKADDKSVQYTIVPGTPWGELTIRWWADTHGYCFDLVDITQHKIRAIPKDLQFVLKSGLGRGSTCIETLEEGHRLANTGPTSALVEYPLNDDGIVEERYSVSKRASLGLCKRGSKSCKTLIALLVGPEATFISGPAGVPVYHSFPPV